MAPEPSSDGTTSRVGRSAEMVGDADENLACDSRLNGVVSGGRVFEREPGERQPGIDPHRKSTRLKRSGDVLRGKGKNFLPDGVEKQTLLAHVLGEACHDRSGELVAVVVRVVRDAAVVRENLHV